MEYILNIILVCFFLLLCFYLIILIIQGVSYIVYQKSNKIYFSLNTYCYLENFYFSLLHKNNKIDTVLAFGKFRGKYYFLGCEGIYIGKKFNVSKVDVLDLNQSEIVFINGMINDTKSKAIHNRDTLSAFLEHCDVIGNTGDGSMC